MIDVLIVWSVSVFVPLLLFIFKPQWRFFSICLSCGILCFYAIIDISLIFNDNLWGLMQTELNASKSIFFTYESILICLYLALLFVAYKYIKIRAVIFIYFVLCNILLPFNLMENFLFGK